MLHLRVELHPVQLFFFTLDSGIGGRRGMADGGKALRQAADIVHMAHPADGLLRQSLKKRAFGIVVHRRFAEFAGFGACDLTPQGMAHHLQAVAQPQNGNPQPEYRRVHTGRPRLVYAVRSAGKDDPDGRKLPDLFHGLLVGMHLAVYPQIPHPARNELVILPAEIQYQNRLVFHFAPHLFLVAVQ